MIGFFIFHYLFVCAGTFLIYLSIALFVHRRDRKMLERMAIDKGVNVKKNYSWRGVFLEISHKAPPKGEVVPSKKKKRRKRGVVELGVRKLKPATIAVEMKDL